MLKLQGEVLTAVFSVGGGESFAISSRMSEDGLVSLITSTSKLQEGEGFPGSNVFFSYKNCLNV